MLRDMKTQAHLKPGQKGTKRLVAEYGASLLCVRYRYDRIRGVRLKTVEIVLEEKPGRCPQRRETGTPLPCMSPTPKRPSAPN
uniref:Uncharacterized protein n=1 Tax=Geobacter sp. (strain M21) TaxID=443144 RepID=C6DYV4_GEOSM